MYPGLRYRGPGWRLTADRGHHAVALEIKGSMLHQIIEQVVELQALGQVLFDVDQLRTKLSRLDSIQSMGMSRQDP